MDVREKLVELIHKAKLSMWGKNGLSNEKAQNSYIADYLIAHGVTVQEWIPVKDRLPEKGGYYLVCQNGKSWFDEVIQTARWNQATQRFCGAQAGCFMEFVTHWMPLPQPPKGE